VFSHTATTTHPWTSGNPAAIYTYKRVHANLNTRISGRTKAKEEVPVHSRNDLDLAHDNIRQHLQVTLGWELTYQLDVVQFLDNDLQPLKWAPSMSDVLGDWKAIAKRVSGRGVLKNTKLLLQLNKNGSSAPQAMVADTLMGKVTKKNTILALWRDNTEATRWIASASKPTVTNRIEVLVTHTNGWSPLPTIQGSPAATLPSGAKKRMNSPVAAPVQTNGEAAMEEDGMEDGSPSVATKLRFSPQPNDDDSVDEDYDDDLDGQVKGGPDAMKT
jgi:hypothetical protein